MPITEYEEQRNNNVKNNIAIMESFGLVPKRPHFSESSTRKKADYRIVPSKKTNCEESESDYDPLVDENSESEESAESLGEEEEMPMAVTSRPKVSQNSHMAPGSRRIQAPRSSPHRDGLEPLYASEPRGVSKTTILRMTRSLNDANDQTSRMNLVDQASENAGQLEDGMSFPGEVCAGLLKDGVRQQRYRLKRKYFDGVLENEVLSNRPPNVTQEDWAKLVDKWSEPQHKATCIVNKRNRGKVQLQQTTGSQCYIAKRFTLRERGNGEEADALDLFKTSHYSRKKGYSDIAQEVIDAMETARDAIVEEGEEPKPVDEIVGGVLAEYSPATKFLQNMGIASASLNQHTNTSSTARMRELEQTIQDQSSQIQNACRNEHELRSTIISQQEEMTDLKNQVEEAKESNKKHEQELANLKKQQEMTNSLLLRLLSQSSTN